MRVIKAAEVRKEEILDIAERLFETTGFNGTSTNDILNAAGIARGTLYHHFESKEAVLDAVVQRACKEALASAAKVATDRSIPVLDRIFMTQAAARPNPRSMSWVVDQLHRPQNALMHAKMHETMLKGLVPLLTAIVEEGIVAGVFSTNFPAESVEMALIYGVMAFDDEVFGSDGNLRSRRIQAFMYNLERIFGVAEGSMAHFAAFMAQQD